MISIKKRPIKKGDVKHIIPNDDTGVFNDFIKEIKDKDFNLDIFYRNIKKVEMIECNQKDMGTGVSVAEYNGIFNIIRFVKDYFKIGIMHELFHLASTVVGKKRLYVGFYQCDIESGKGIGYGLNEGYTCLLDKRYFKDYDERKEKVIGESYSVSVSLVSLLETLIGKELMEKWYSEADLHSLVDFLSNIMGYERTLEFINSLDKIFYYCDNIFIPNAFKTIKSYENAIRYIGEAFLNQVIKLYVDELITDEEYEDMLDNIKIIVNKQIKFGKLKLIQSHKMNDVEFDDIVKKTLKKYT